MSKELEKSSYSSPSVEVLRLGYLMSVLDYMSLNTGWQDFVDGDEEDQY